jgi:ABC-type Mn2+/Zn2+ transport system ATPase subunit
MADWLGSTALAVYKTVRVHIDQHFTLIGHFYLDPDARYPRTLVGDNGADKSTLIKVLAGVHQPSPCAWTLLLPAR